MKNVWGIADLHLAISTPSKHMSAFGPVWENYEERIRENWEKLVKEDDLVLIPGDISWAMHFDEALVDLKWIDTLPGTKVILKGNHDYWWPSAKKLRDHLPPSIHFIYNNVYNWGNLSIGGVRLWDSDEYTFNDYIEFQENPLAKEKPYRSPEEKTAEDRKVFVRDLARLELSLKQLDPKAKTRIAMTHYPPIGANLTASAVSKLLKKYGVSICLFGHLHNVRPGTLPFGEKDGITYQFLSADYINFTPQHILSIS